MTLYRHAALAATCMFTAIAAPLHAESIYSEQDKLIRADRNVGTLGADLFGDKVNFYNGTLEFTQTDVSLPGNNALPVSIGRRLVPGSEARVFGAFADWDLDIPHLHGVFASGATAYYGNGWSSQNGPGRCSNYGPPSGASYQGGSWNPDEYWHGSFMYLPGAGSQEILSRAGTNNTNVPSDGNAWPLATRSMASLRCITNQQGGGEGFLAVTPDGTQYRFDWLVSRNYQPVTKPSPAPEFRQAGRTARSTGTARSIAGPQPNVADGYLLRRQEVWILPTLVTDRYGNTVTYTYNPAAPWQLTSIASSDGRTITLS
jgi:YD repeat-containing protein